MTIDVTLIHSELIFIFKILYQGHLKIWWMEFWNNYIAIDTVTCLYIIKLNKKIVFIKKKPTTNLRYKKNS